MVQMVTPVQCRAGELKKPILGSMRTKLIIAFLIIILIPIVTVTIYSITSMTERSKGQIEAKLKSDAVAANLLLDAEIKKYNALSLSLANDNSIKTPLYLGVRYQLDEYGKSLKEKYNDIDEIGIFNWDGSIIYSTTTEYSKQVKGAIATKASVSGIVSKDGLNIVSVNPILTSNGQVIGAVMVVHNLNKDKQLFMQISLKLNTSVLLYEDINLVMMGTADRKVIIPGTGREKTIAFKEALETDNYFNKNPAYVFGANYFFNYKTIKDISGKTVGAIAVAEKDSELESIIWDTFIVIGIILIVCILFTLGAAFVASSLFTRPMINLENLMNKVENGDLTVRATDLKDDEIGRLSFSFNKMVEELNTYIRELGEAKHELKLKNEELIKYNSEIHTGYLQTVMALANSIEAKDSYTRGHCQRVMEISCEFGKYIGYTDMQIEELRYAAILHDIGKIGVPAAILNKQGKLTDLEFSEIKKHPLTAYNILKEIGFIKNSLEAVLQHHERYDGKGYPYGIKGEQISHYARILCIADAFDAMTSNRPYRDGITIEAALKEIKKCGGTQFDPEITEAFIKMCREEVIISAVI